MLTASSLGIIIDIVGAILLAKAMFLEPANLTANFGYIDKHGKTIPFYGPDRISSRCAELAQARLGLILLVVGFLLQLVGQITENSNLYETFMHAKRINQFCIAIAIIFFVFVLKFELARWDCGHRKFTLFELWYRVDNNPEDDSQLSLPAGLAWDHAIEFMNVILKINEPKWKIPSKTNETLEEYRKYKEQKLKSLSALRNR